MQGIWECPIPGDVYAGLGRRRRMSLIVRAFDLWILTTACKFFLDIWDQLQDRSSDQDIDKQISGDMTVQDVANKTSSAVISGDDDGALFDETAGAYKLLQERTEEMIVAHISNSVFEELKAYSRMWVRIFQQWLQILINYISTNWSSIDNNAFHTSGQDTTHLQLTVTPEITQPLTTLDSFYDYLSVKLAHSRIRITRQTTSMIQTHILDYVVSRNQFSLLGARQLLRDCTEIWSISARYSPVRMLEGATRRLKETCLLLTLPLVDGEQVPERDALEDLLEDSGIGGGKKLMGLRSAVSRVFEDHEQAQKMMEEFGIRELQIADVRGLLRRRVDAWA